MKLKGNSGLIYDDDGKLVMHINAPYDSNGMVFVEIADENNDEYGCPSWQRMSLEDAHRKGLTIIKCCQCLNPATGLDHHWPFMSGMNLCDEHEYNPEIKDLIK